MLNMGIVCCLNAEEMLSTNFALWWSPDGTRILYASFNDTLVGPFSFPKYGSLEEQLQYTEIESIFYPKVSCLKMFLGCCGINGLTQCKVEKSCCKCIITFCSYMYLSTLYL